MRDILERVAAGELSPDEAEARLKGYVPNEAGRFDATRERRSGVPEAVFGVGKTPAEVTELAVTSLESTGRVIATRIERETRETVRDRLTDLDRTVETRVDERANLLVAHAEAYDPPALAATVGVVTAGTADILPAREATVVAEEMGADVSRTEDVGVAGLSRLLDELDRLRQHDVLVVAAGREGALPTVVAGLVDVPVIGLPVASGYGHGGDGEAALAGLLQSCTALSVVNVNAGFTAGAQAGLIARQLDRARSGEAKED
jgi:NCAIR mutase (PurE)-related protein